MQESACRIRLICTDRQTAAEQPVIHLLQRGERHAGRRHFDQARGAARDKEQQFGIARGSFQKAEQGITGGKTAAIRYRVTGFEAGETAIIRQIVIRMSRF